jgi:NAD+ kinase
MSDVLIVPHGQRADALALARTTMSWLAEHGHRAVMMTEDAQVMKSVDVQGGDTLGPIATFVDPSDLVLAIGIGGDGTMLRTVHALRGAAVPVMGVHAGLLGYLTEVEPPQLTTSLERFFADDHEIEPRMMLSVAVTRADGAVEPTRTALNEASLEKQVAGHTVRLLVRIDGAAFTSYQADGLIVATPTGSTAYSLSARGPVVSPRHRAILLTPVSPHMLFDRSLVLDPDEDIEVEVTGHRPVELTVDGQRVVTLSQGDVVHISPADCVAHFVRLVPRRFHQILKAKFGLSDR